MRPICLSSRLNNQVHVFIISCLLLIFSAQVHATPNPKTSFEEDSTQTKDPSLGQRSFAATAALIPGLLIGGSGHWLIGQNESAKALFWTKLSGTLGLLTMGSALATSGASNLVTPWATPALILSGASFVLPTALDLIGVWNSSKLAPHIPSVTSAPLLNGRGQTSLALISAMRKTSLVAPHLLYGFSFGQDLGQLAYQLGGSWSDKESRYELRGERLCIRRSGWSLWCRLGATSHHFIESDVSLNQAELSFIAPLKLGSLLGASLSSMSAQLGVGWSGGALTFAEESSDAFTGVIGGFRLTYHSLLDRLRTTVSYEHRHDDWVGGALVPGLGSGILGYISSTLSWRIFRVLWISIEASFGASHLYTFNVEYSVGGESK